MKLTNKMKVQIRNCWMTRVQQLILNERPGLVGTLDWDAITFLYNQGMGATEAAKRYLNCPAGAYTQITA